MTPNLTKHKGDSFFNDTYSQMEKMSFVDFLKAIFILIK